MVDEKYRGAAFETVFPQVEVTVQSLAQEMSRAFETRKRRSVDTGADAEYVVLKDGSPEWMTDVCHKAHQDEIGEAMLPDDWRYRFIEDAVDALAECEIEDDQDGHLREYVYTHDLTGWLHSRNDRYGYCDDALQELGGPDQDFLATLSRGLWIEQQEVFYLVLQALKERVEELEG